jgi:hypothetical protein
LEGEEAAVGQEEFELIVGRDWVDMEGRMTAGQRTREWRCTLELKNMGAPFWEQTLQDEKEMKITGRL